MPRWKALPDELDPQIKEFADQLRRLVDRSGLSISALSDRTGYSKTSWERYLNGRLLAPKGAVVALAEVTGTNPIHLTTMWELAERAWSRSEMRHDMTMEALRIAQARAALGEFGAPPANTKGRTARRGGSATATPGIAGPAGVAPTVPPQPTAPDANAREAEERPAVNSWGLAGYTGPSPAAASGRPGAGAGVNPASSGAGTGSNAASAGRAPGAGAPTPPAPGNPSGGASRRKRLAMFLAGAVAVVVVAGAAYYLTRDGGDPNDTANVSPPPSVSTDANLPPGVKCSGDTCAGKDAEAMGCSGDLVTTARTATVGTTVVEVRYSETCGAAWGRITQAAQGDKVQVTVGTTKENGSITTAGDTIAYTPMVAVQDAGEATACATLASGEQGCTQ
ncbi:hypothetical protein SSP24_55900 [Streptomyces spinoverrucosus]|uniref:HTH cro/C1-type domain-containing protein n=1 Tax=Streptomyces spinoverrucosus TaxID=284043 RepID=A0A4Y3VPI9_9ACTN|nr:XRE family transcriptional regulator [Streptomyces spinoverrucosus]GEC07935.1 hypothetical protein SSP24_55900 [Streptomyces spinoverrucosus]GHB85886.1 hypothetical protein GCM10010397_66640 [Streptomyces spinoverrucosus]